jgi:hypothetical protein
MSRLTNKQLQDLIKEAYAAWYESERQRRDKLRDVIAISSPSYDPADDPIGELLRAESDSSNGVKKAFLRRLKQIEYPFPKSARKKTVETTYEVVRKQKLLGALLSPTFISYIKLIWFLQSYYSKERHFHELRESKFGYPLVFHRKAMWQMARHLQSLESLAAKHHVPEDWFSEYRPAILKVLLREAVIFYPQLAFENYKEARRILPVKSAGDLQMETFRAIKSIQPKGRVISNNLAYHLTALICSPISVIDNHRLEPTPTGVGRNIRARQ